MTSQLHNELEFRSRLVNDSQGIRRSWWDRLTQGNFTGGAGFLAGWSPDGKQIGYGGWGETDAVSFSIVNLESGRALRVPITGATMPAWSPDGSMLAFDVRVGGGGPWAIWMVDTKTLETLNPER